MALETLINGAVQLGVIPMLALFLVWRMHNQNEKLIEHMHEREKESMKWIGMIVQDFMDGKGGSSKKEGGHAQ